MSHYVSLVARLRAQNSYYRSRCGSLAQQVAEGQKQLSAYREDKNYGLVRDIVEDSDRGEKKAAFLLHQIRCYGVKRPSYPEDIIRECVIWRFASPKGYDHARAFLTLPAKCTIQKYVGPSPTSSGMSAAMKERLILEASMLSSKQHMASLIIDEASIKPKCLYERKADTIFGFKDRTMARPAAQMGPWQIEYCALFFKV